MSSFVLKIIACVAMLIDHIGYALYPNVAILRMIGRIALPIFAFQVALGFRHTKDKEKYILRMFLFAVISQIPFSLLTSIHTSTFRLNIGITFLLALLLLYSIEDIKPIWAKILCSLVVIALSCFLKYDYYIYGIALVLIFYYTFNNKKVVFPFYYVTTMIYCMYRKSLLQIYSLFSLIPIMLYNGKKGPSFKYFFYAFYPLHMLAIYIIFKLCS